MTFDLDTLVRQLGERLQADESLRAYLLVDPMLHEPLEDALLQAEGCTATTIPIQRPGLKPDQKPRLVAWRPQAVGVLRASLKVAGEEQADPIQEASRGIAIGGWLLSPEPAEVVAHHLAQHMWIIRPGTGRTYLRLADRRIFEWMWEVWGAEHKRDLFGPLAAWWTLDRCGALVERLPPGGENHAERKENRPPFTLTPAQWTHADQCELAQHMIRGWQRLQEVLPPDYLTRTRNAIEAARSLGLGDGQDILLMGAYVLQIHPRLGDHPRVRTLVTEARGSQTALGDALASVPDPDGWDEIRLELEKHHPQSRGTDSSTVEAAARAANLN